MDSGRRSDRPAGPRYDTTTRITTIITRTLAEYHNRLPIIPNEGTNIPYLWCSYIFVFTLNLVKQDLWNQRGVWVFERTIFLVGFHEEMLHVGRMRVKVTDL